MGATAEQASPWLEGRSFSSWQEEYDRRGYLIFKNVLKPDRVADIRAALAPHLARDLRDATILKARKPTGSTPCSQNRRCSPSL